MATAFGAPVGAPDAVWRISLRASVSTQMNFGHPAERASVGGKTYAVSGTRTDRVPQRLLRSTFQAIEDKITAHAPNTQSSAFDDRSPTTDWRLVFNPTALSSLERNRPHIRPNVAQIGTKLQDFLACSLYLLLSGCTAPPPPFVPQVNEPTTHIVEPLDEAGLVDFLEAANQRLAKGVSPEDNWEVVVRRAFGPLDWDEASDAEYYRRLGIPPVPAITENGNYYQPPCPDTNETELEKKRQDQFWDAMTVQFSCLLASSIVSSF